MMTPLGSDDGDDDEGAAVGAGESAVDQGKAADGYACSPPEFALEPESEPEPDEPDEPALEPESDVESEPEPEFEVEPAPSVEPESDAEPSVPELASEPAPEDDAGVVAPSPVEDVAGESFVVVGHEYTPSGQVQPGNESLQTRHDAQA